MASVPPCLLRYDASREILSGVIGGESFCFKAYSGGGRGSTRPAEEWDQSLSSHSATTKKDKLHRGGTLPSGYYLCEYMGHHPRFHDCVRLHRTETSAAIYSPFSCHPIAHHRDDDFFIHGRGEQGSDGCIVPEKPAERRKLNNAIRQYGGRVGLQVVGTSYVLPAELMRGIIA